MRELEILRAGPCSTVQDAGRFRQGRFGIVRSGPLDVRAAQLANVLVGNSEDMAVIEWTGIGDTISLPQRSLISFTGGLSKVMLIDDHGREIPLPLGRPILLKEGGVVRAGTMHQGWRTYLAIAGGIDVPLVLNSRSTYLRAKLGGYQGRRLLAGDRLLVGEATPVGQKIIERLIGNNAVDAPYSTCRWTARVGNLPGEAMETIGVIPSRIASDNPIDIDLTSRVYTITPDSDRMGYRFEGPPIPRIAKGEPLSEGVLPGTLQLPPNGQPILLMYDCAPTGGYPILGHVPQAELSHVAQMRPGQQVRWRRTTQAQALAQLSSDAMSLRRIKNFIRFWV